MKKIIVILGLLTIISCDFNGVGLLTDIDKEAIKAQIELLEESLNDSDYDDFMDCFHDECDYQEVFDEGVDFADLISDNPYSFRHYEFEDNGMEVSVVTEGAIVTCDTKNALGDTDSKFEMRKDGMEWKIWKWEFDGSTVFREIKN